MKLPLTILGLLACAGTAVAGPPRYSIRELTPINPDGSSWGWAVHADGRVAGARTLDGNQTIGAVWTPDGATDYGPFPGGEHTWATALGAGQAVFGMGRRPFLFANSITAWASRSDLAPTLLAFLPQYFYTGTMEANAENRVVGWAQVQLVTGSHQPTRAYTVLVDGVLRDPVLIPTLGGWSNWGNAINDQGVVVGGSLTASGPLNAFRWSSGTPLALGTLGGPASEAIDINNAGLVVGWAMDSTGAKRAFLHEAGSMRDLGTLGGATAEARGINDAGVIVGESWTASGGLRAFVVHGSTMHDLHTLTPDAESQGWILTHAEDVSPSGVIVGWGTRLVDGRRLTRGFRLDPHCAADIDGDGVIDLADVLQFLTLFDAMDPRADLTADGLIDFGDYLDFLNELDSGC